MTCTQARFLVYAYLDRDISTFEAEALSRHLSECASCELRARSARGLARVLRAHLDRATAPPWLRYRIQKGEPPRVRHRAPVFATAAALLLLVLPLVAHDPGPASSPEIPLASAGVASLPGIQPARSHAAPFSRKVTLTGMLVCLQCETSDEAGIHRAHSPRESGHDAGLCAEDGHLWRLMARNPSFVQVAAGQTVTVEGVEFPQSGFLRASRVGY